VGVVDSDGLQRLARGALLTNELDQALAEIHRVLPPRALAALERFNRCH
jgi:hypothetical protein